MLNPQLLATFATIVSAGSISAAAVRLGCGKSVVSRQLARLEADLGTRLIQRTTRKLSLTDVGEAFLRHCQAVRESALAAQDTVAQVQTEPRGTIRVRFGHVGGVFLPAAVHHDVADLAALRGLGHARGVPGAHVAGAAHGALAIKHGLQPQGVLLDHIGHQVLNDGVHVHREQNPLAQRVLVEKRLNIYLV